ncbi:MAG: amidase [Gemmatimonadaceae bacterium]|nr:amidase [Gemmatimonadaceae bacterium]
MRRHVQVGVLLLASATLASTTTAQPVAPASRGTVEVTEATIAELRTAMASGRVSSVQLVDAYLARIAAYEHAGPSLNALIRLNPKARAEAAQRDAERRQGRLRGALHGIPIIIKDNYDTGDMPTSAGSLALANSQPAQDAFVVKKLRDAGAVILAKSNLHEFAAGITSISSLGGQTRNPYDPTRCPGGSSGGTGAAIAASFATVGWGSDTCGSIRIPSAYGSLFGLRPTQGLISRSGIIPLSHTQDIGGPLARTATDLAIALDVSVGYDAADSVTVVLRDKPLPHFEAALDKNALRGARIGVFQPYFRDTDAEIADTVRAAIAAMKALGATIVEVPVVDFDSLIANTGVIPYETKFDLINYLRGVPNAPVHSMREILDQGLFDRALEARFRSIDTVQSLDTDRYRTTLRRQTLLRSRMERIMDSLSLDALAYPTMRQKPTLVGEPQLGGTCNLSAQSGLPAISIPAGFMAEGLPVGIELMGRALTDVRLVALAYAFEQSGPRRRAPSTTPALVRGAVPVALPMTVRAISSRATATARLTYDAPRSVLRWSVALTGASPDEVVAVVLRRTTEDLGGTTPAPTRRVVARLLGPGMRAASGSMLLGGTERRALVEGRLTLAMYDQTGAVPVEVAVPKR